MLDNLKKGVQGEEDSERAIQGMMERVNELVDWNNQGFLHNLIKANTVRVFRSVFQDAKDRIIKRHEIKSKYRNDAAYLNVFLHANLPIWPSKKGGLK